MKDYHKATGKNVSNSAILPNLIYFKIIFSVIAAALIALVVFSYLQLLQSRKQLEVIIKGDYATKCSESGSSSSLRGISGDGTKYATTNDCRTEIKK